MPSKVLEYVETCPKELQCTKWANSYTYVIKSGRMCWKCRNIPKCTKTYPKVVQYAKCATSCPNVL